MNYLITHSHTFIIQLVSVLRIAKIKKYANFLSLKNLVEIRYSSGAAKVQNLFFAGLGGIGATFFYIPAT